MSKNEPKDEFLEEAVDAFRPPPMTSAEKALFAERVRARIGFRPHSMTAVEKARLALGVRERIARRSGWRLAVPAGIAAAAALGFAALLPGGDAPPSFVATSDRHFSASWEEEMLFSPEWVGGSSDWLDEELMSTAYAAASIALDS